MRPYADGKVDLPPQQQAVIETVRRHAFGEAVELPELKTVLEMPGVALSAVDSLKYDPQLRECEDSQSRLRAIARVASQHLNRSLSESDLWSAQSSGGVSSVNLGSPTNATSSRGVNLGHSGTSG